jgi:general stress protein 26
MGRLVRPAYWLVALVLSVAFAPRCIGADEKVVATPEREKLVAAARELMGMQKYCALITVDRTGRPQVRTMNPFPPEEDMAVWFATNTRSRKVREIRNDPRVCLYYADHGQAVGYVAITGTAMLVDDMKEIKKRKRDYWDTSFPGLKNLVLVKVVPEKLDILFYKHGILGDSVTWRTQSVDMTPQASH